jgi:thiamine biosynthesis lipoprotein
VWVRRAQPLLGTLVEVGVRASERPHGPAIDAAFTAVRAAQACLSRFEADSDIGRFAALRCGEPLTVRPITRQVLAAACLLQTASGGAFDVSLGSGPQGWALDGDRLHKLSPRVQLDLGGIGKGHAVDLAVQALVAHGVDAGWVNAGGDLRAFGDVDTPVQLRDEATGGVRTFASLRDGAFATSHFGTHSRARLAAPAPAPVPASTSTQSPSAHVSVAAPLCLWADALTKVVALSGDTSHPLLASLGARAWLH